MSNLFTRSQWQELEYQAMIYKYIDAGVPVPPYLLVPISQNPHLGSSGFLHPSSLAYSYFGKRIDSEPGRCRRTDGKKWRCSKDAHPDSKYCERHMNRSRNRSRKLVESKNNSQPSTSAAASEITAGSGKASSTNSHLSLNPVANSGTLSSISNLSRWCLETSPYGAGSKEYRSLHGLKPGFGGNSSLPEASTTSSIVMNSNLQSQWKPVSQFNSSSMTEQKDLAQYHSSYSQQHMFQDFGTIDATISEQPFFSGKEFGFPISMKQENQYLYPLFDEWPNQISDKSSPTVQLSMSTITNPFSMGGHSTSDT